mgnify:CR=1 FL=1
MQDLLEGGVHKSKAQPIEGGFGKIAAFLPCYQHLPAGGDFGVRKGVMLFYDQRPSQRDNHQRAEDAAEDGKDQDSEVVEELRPAAVAQE